MIYCMDLSRLVRELFPQASPELAALYAGAIDNAALLQADFLSVRDLIDLSGHTEHESLQALLLVMFVALSEGSLCVESSPAGLARRLADLEPTAPARVAETWAQRISADLEQQRFPNLIGPSSTDDMPVLLHTQNGRSHLYFHKYLRSELVFQRELQRRLHPAAEDGVDWAPNVREVLESNKVLFDHDQRTALGLALARQFLVISGGPGTGKTSLVLSLLRCLVRGNVAPQRIALAAPTGRAAQRLSDSLRAGLTHLDPSPADTSLQQLQAKTLHQLLEYNPSRGIFRRHEENPLPADVVIVDEVSMVGVVLMAQLLQALRPGARLILLGDKDQLPSVDAGAVLSSLVPQGEPNRFGADTWKRLERIVPGPQRGADLVCAAGSWPEHLVILQTNHRSQPQIREAAAAINRQQTDIVAQLPVLAPPESDTDWHDLHERGGCWLLEQTGQPQELRRALQAWASQHFLGDFPQTLQAFTWTPTAEDDASLQETFRTFFQRADSRRILTVLREGSWGSAGINAYLDQYLRPHFDRVSQGMLFAGAPVLITANDHMRGLYNGDVGLTLRSTFGLRVVFQRQGRFVSFPAESLPPHERGFALTVHKSQGSEYDCVFLVLPPTGGRRLLTKEILYTGLTRARRLAVVCATRAVLELAIRQRTVRDSAFAQT